MRELRFALCARQREGGFRHRQGCRELIAAGVGAGALEARLRVVREDVAEVG